MLDARILAMNVLVVDHSAGRTEILTSKYELIITPDVRKSFFKLGIILTTEHFSQKLFEVLLKRSFHELRRYNKISILCITKHTLQLTTQLLRETRLSCFNVKTNYFI